ncbi:MAG: DoxX family protein [Gammaproteobacteria bacterium]|nr:DoxX family protein [Gammaproteobacteria bacterium]|tara:strand:+ start:75 stop:521 length:447 start_codon:yes stop_codon:yes gene_type:complete
MNKLNKFLEELASPLKKYAIYLLRIGLGTSFFLHGYGKLPIQQSFISWLSSKGIPLAEITAHLIAWGEIVSGIGILTGGLIGSRAYLAGVLITRLSGGAVMIIMIGALLIAHSDWGIFFGERGSILFASEQLFLLLLGTYFAIKGNDA